MLLYTLIFLLVSVHVVPAVKHGHGGKAHSNHNSHGHREHKNISEKTQQPRAMIWPKKLMPSLQRMLSHRRHHHQRHSYDDAGLNGESEADTINLENRIQGMLGTGMGGTFGTSNNIFGNEEFPDAAGRSSSDRYLVDRIMHSVNSETGDEANAFQDMMSELRMVKEAKEKKELLSTLGLNGLGFNNNRPPPMAEVSTVPPARNKYQGGRFESPGGLPMGTRMPESLPQTDLPEQNEGQPFAPSEGEDQMTQSPFREEQPRFRDEQPRFEENSQDVGGMEMKPMEARDERTEQEGFQPQQNEPELDPVRGNFARDRWPEEAPPEMPQLPQPEEESPMMPPRNPGPLDMTDTRELLRMPEQERPNNWDPMPGDRRIFKGIRPPSNRVLEQIMSRYTRPGMTPQLLKAANMEPGPARILDPSHPRMDFRSERGMTLPGMRRHQFPRPDNAYARTQTYSFMNTGPPPTQEPLFNGRGLPFRGGKPFPPQSPDFMLEPGGRGMPSLKHSNFLSEQESNMFMRPDGRYFSNIEEGGREIQAYRKGKVIKTKHAKSHKGTIVDGTKFRAKIKHELNQHNNASVKAKLEKKLSQLSDTNETDSSDTKNAGEIQAHSDEKVQGHEKRLDTKNLPILHKGSITKQKKSFDKTKVSVKKKTETQKPSRKH